MVSLDRSYTTFYWLAIVTIAITITAQSYTIFELFVCRASCRLPDHVHHTEQHLYPGLSVEMDHWVCLSYDEMIRFKQSDVTLHTSDHVTGVPYSTAFTHWVTVNVDHVVRSLGGFGTFHRMVTIAGLTYRPSVADVGPSINRCRWCRHISKN